MPISINRSITLQGARVTWQWWLRPVTSACRSSAQWRWRLRPHTVQCRPCWLLLLSAARTSSRACRCPGSLLDNETLSATCRHYTPPPPPQPPIYTVSLPRQRGNRLDSFFCSSSANAKVKSLLKSDRICKSCMENKRRRFLGEAEYYVQ